jgi:hypothetical protein
MECKAVAQTAFGMFDEIAVSLGTSCATRQFATVDADVEVGCANGWTIALRSRDGWSYFEFLLDTGKPLTIGLPDNARDVYNSCVYLEKLAGNPEFANHLRKIAIEITTADFFGRFGANHTRLIRKPETNEQQDSFSFNTDPHNYF